MPLPLRVLDRYFRTGQEMRGLGDNATFLHRATVDYRARPYVKLTGPIWQRLARRHAAFTAPVLIAIFAGWQAALVWWALLTLAGTVWSVRHVGRLLRRRRLHRDFIDPAARVLFTLIGARYIKRAGRAAIELPPDWGSEAQGAVRVNIPAATALSPRLKAQITSNVGARLGIPDAQGDWREAGAGVCVEISAMPQPPAEVTFASLRKAIDECSDNEIVVGRKAQNHIVTVSLTEDSPHFLMSGAAGTGKSVLIRTMLVQRGLKGDGLIILDPKRFSHWRWAGGGKLSKDQVIYAYRDDDLHETWVAIGEEIKRRIELPEDELAEQRRVIVTVEEINVQTKKLARYWRGLRKEIILAAKQAQAEDAPFDPADLDPPLQSPAIVAMQESVCMGRELRMHVLVAAQRASANVFGGNGGDIRESFQGGRFIAKWDRKLWKMLVDTIDYIACPSRARGIWGLARGDSFEVFRAPLITEQEALELLQGCEMSRGPVLGAGWTPVEAPSRPAIVQAVKLSEALPLLPARADGDQLSLDRLRAAAKRDPLFPAAIGQEGNAKTYDLSAIIHWWDDRASV